MQVELLSEINNFPKKLGRIEVQQSALNVDIFAVLLVECHRLAAQGNPRAMIYAGHKYERVQDGAGVWHYNLYAYYDPVDSELELPPRNLNDAEQNVLGQVLNGDQLADIGMAERRLR